MQGKPRWVTLPDHAQPPVLEDRTDIAVQILAFSRENAPLGLPTEPGFACESQGPAPHRAESIRCIRVSISYPHSTHPLRGSSARLAQASVLASPATAPA